MKINPVYKRELTVSSRSARLTVILLVFNSILALVALLNMYSTVVQVRQSAEIQYSNFLDLYAFVAAIEFILLMFIVPAITSGSISGERERQTLDLMLTTKMTPAQIVLGKLASSVSTIFLLIISSFPVLSLVFVYGGVTWRDLALLLLCYAAVTLYAGSLGICCSCIFKRSTAATVVSYSVIAIMVAGTYAVNFFALSLSQMRVQAYMQAMNMPEITASSGGALYLLLLNPTVTFFLILNGQSSSSGRGYRIAEWFGAHSENFITMHWVAISIAVQFALAALFLAVAVRALKRQRER